MPIMSPFQVPAEIVPSLEVPVTVRFVVVAVPDVMVLPSILALPNRSKL